MVERLEARIEEQDTKLKESKRRLTHDFELLHVAVVGPAVSQAATPLTSRRAASSAGRRAGNGFNRGQQS